MIAVSENTGSAPLIDSSVIRDRVSDGSIWREKGSLDPRFDTKLRKPRPDRGGSDTRWSEKVPQAQRAIH